jgi:hypothetical protein
MKQAVPICKLACVSLIGLLMIAWPARVNAQSAAITATATCDFLGNDCATVDSTASLNSITLALSSAGVWTATCRGTTTTKPSKITHCDGETLNTGTEAVPINACELQLGSGVTNGPVFTDDWTETIGTSGKVTLRCNFNPKEKAK